MIIKLTWRKRAIILFSVAIFLLSIVLAIFAIREAEREKLVRKMDIEEEQQRLTELLVKEVEASVSEAEERISKLIGIPQNQSDEKGLKEVCQRIAESEELVSEIFLINKRGDVSFPLGKSLFLLPHEGRIRKKQTMEIERHPLLKKAEMSEFKAKNYSLAIESYQKLMGETSDDASHAILLNCIGRCFAKSGNPFKAIEAYQKILKKHTAVPSPDGIPLGLIAQYQIGSIYWNINRKMKAVEAFFELHENILESRWPLSKNQFYFYRKKVKAMLDTSLESIDESGVKKSFMEKGQKFNQLEEEKLSRMQARENLVTKVIPLIKTKTSSSISSFGNFYHHAETIGNEAYLVSCTSIKNNTVLGIRIDSEVLSKKLLPEILGRLPLKKDWHVQIKDEFGNAVSGKDMTSLQKPLPQLTFSQGFEENFPPWKVNVFQSELGLAERQFKQRRNIYLFSVGVVIVALFFGGFLAIRSTAKELELAKLKSEFVSTVSHDFRTPLTSIRYLAELLKRRRVKEEAKKQLYYETITDESERLSRLVENILDFSKIEAEMKEYQFEETGIAELAKDVASRFQRQTSGKKFLLETEIPEQMPKVLADKEAISRALFNVLDNALKFRGQSPRAFLRVWSNAQSVFLEVEDEGIGISKEEQKKVFEKFYRSDETHKISIKGSGIGLTLTAHIIKAHGGEVLLESDAGKGTKVTMVLPVKQTKARKKDKNG